MNKLNMILNSVGEYLSEISVVALILLVFLAPGLVRGKLVEKELEIRSKKQIEIQLLKKHSSLLNIYLKSQDKIRKAQVKKSSEEFGDLIKELEDFAMLFEDKSLSNDNLKLILSNNKLLCIKIKRNELAEAEKIVLNNIDLLNKTIKHIMEGMV